LFANWNLPWNWDLGRDYHLQYRLDLSIGCLSGQDHSAAIGSIGPTGVLSRQPWPFSLEGGVSPTGMSHSEFGSKDFSTEIQFTSHAGVNWDFAAHWRIGYRFQHMSNADLGAQNPGLNLHMLALSYVF
jgi:hypothetical protein